MKKMLCTLCLLLIVAGSVQSAVLSQWRGPQRNGIYPDTGLLKSWPAQGPALVWKATGLGKGYSSAAVVNGKVYVTGLVGEQGQVIALDATGKQLWKTIYGPEWNGDFPGSRCTPTVVDGKLYIESGNGKVVCLDAVKGTMLWSVDLVATFGAEIIQWGMVENLLVDGDHLICTPGGPKTCVVALDRNTGKPVWKSESIEDKAGYCSPILVQRGTRRLIVTMTAKNIVAVDADAGKVLWKHPHITEWDVNPNAPLYQDGCIFAVSGYGTGGVKLELAADGASVKELWRNKTMDCQIGAYVFIEGYLYGAGQYKNKWHCVDWINGETKHSSNLLARGAVVSAEGLMYCYTERGELALVQPGATALQLLSSVRITEGNDQHWAHPVIADKKLYVRHGDVLLVYNIAR
jgi:outer membrane protein assembly factor BamB